MIVVCFIDRRLLVTFNAKTEAADANGSAEYHIPHVHVSTGLRRVVLFEWRHVFHRKNCRLSSIQLSVSTSLSFLKLGFKAPVPLTVNSDNELGRKFHPRIFYELKFSRTMARQTESWKISRHLCENAYRSIVTPLSIGRLTVRRGHEQSWRFRAKEPPRGKDGITAPFASYTR